MKIKKKCIEILSIPKIVCEENNQKIIFINKSRKQVSKIHVDGCQITEGKRCDFLILYNHNEHFIELKGSDIKHAIMQLSESIKILGSSINKRYCYIISNRCPLSSAELQVHRLILKKNFNSDLIVKNSRYEVNI